MKPRGRPREFENRTMTSLMIDKNILQSLNQYCENNDLRRNNLINIIIQNFLDKNYPDISQL